MTVYLALILAGSVFALLLTPVVTRLSEALGLVDAPGGRKVHSTSVPRVGGVAIVLSAAAALAIFTVTGPRVGFLPPPFAPLVSTIAAALLVFAVGLVDDFRPVRPPLKIAVQIAAAVLVMTSGLLIERLTFAGQTWQLGMLSWPVTLAWIVGLTNAFNLIDGIDGLAAGIAVIAGATCAAILVGRGHVAEAMLLCALVGAALGFLAYNFAPASIFLGDGGSLVFGFVLATTAITGWQKGATALAAGVPLLIFALPLADTVSALIRRTRRPASQEPVTFVGLLRRISEPDLGHIHHRLVAWGWSTRSTVLVLYGATLVLSLIALMTARFD
jgi:UDP-GlcNAc:undecaprenyl-phosphate GlcNAc-1-phosphate transferase